MLFEYLACVYHLSIPKTHSHDNAIDDDEDDNVEQQNNNNLYECRANVATSLVLRKK